MTLPKPLAAAALLGAVAGSGATLAVQTPGTRPVPPAVGAYVLPSGTNIFTKGEASLAWEAVYLVEGLRGTLDAQEIDVKGYEAARRALGGY